MIYIATVHVDSARWIDIQLSYLARNLHEPFQVYTNLQNVPGDHSTKYDRVVPASGPHSGKLNLIAAEICADGGDDDVILFLDGDAFPIDDPMPTVRASLENSALVAVRRDENATDRQPHPCFCAVTVGEWERLHGDWSPGYCWQAADGRLTTDVGGNLLRALERSGSAWTPLLRTNRVDLHPLWFGVYGDVIYHHGAGFRWAVGRVDLAGGPRPVTLGTNLPLARHVIRRLNRARTARFQADKAAEAEGLRNQVFSRILNDPEFYRAFL